MYNCRSCDGQLSGSQVRYCSIGCQKDFEYKAYIEAWLEGRQPGWTGKTRQLSNYVRRFVRESVGTECSVCGWDERHPDDGAILTEIDHVDGDAENCTPGNLRVLCPNCHSKTSTFRARNKSGKRDRSPCS